MGDIAKELLEKFSDPSHPYNDRLHEIAEFIESLQAQNAELKKENATLRERRADRLRRGLKIVMERLQQRKERLGA